MFSAPELLYKSAAPQPSATFFRAETTLQSLAPKRALQKVPEFWAAKFRDFSKLRVGCQPFPGHNFAPGGPFRLIRPPFDSSGRDEALPALIASPSIIDTISDKSIIDYRPNPTPDSCSATPTYITKVPLPSPSRPGFGPKQASKVRRQSGPFQTPGILGSEIPGLFKAPRRMPVFAGP